jgi:phosphonoacetate hydrolase
MIAGLGLAMLPGSARAAGEPRAITVNGRRYALPRRPTIAICVDGFDPAYLAQGLREGTLPTFARFAASGFAGTAMDAMPSFTNPNNTSIITGVAPAVHGISGNYYLDRATGREVMITDAKLLRCPTILAATSQAGVKVAAITAKDKLREILGAGLKGIVFSSQQADQATLANAGIADVEALVGRKTPDQYSADLSYFVLDAAARLMERRAADLFYLSLSDVIQHSYAPDAPEAKAFMSEVDARIGKLVALGAVVGVTGDHGMKDKSRPDGSPNVIFLEDVLNDRFGAHAVRVICPITDPFVRHHGALGSFVRVYVNGGRARVPDMIETIRGLPGVRLALTGAEAARRFEEPLDQEGDIAVVGDRNTVLGSSRAAHDLSGLKGSRLRSHGGLDEQQVPFLVSAPLSPAYAARARRGLRNFDLFDYLLNGT